MTKFRRRILAMALTVAMILSTVSMAFAQNVDNTDVYTQSANTLQQYGVMKGDNGNLMLNSQLKRQDAVIISLRLMGIKDADFENYDYPSDFSDITDPYYQPIIGMAQDLGLVQGMGDGTFGFNNLIKAQDVQTLLLRALGYEITDAVYPTVPELAKQVGVANLVDVQKDELITRDKVAQMMLNTLNTNVKDSQNTLGSVLGYTDTQEPAQPDPLEITAKVVTEDSIVVTFNRPVEDTSALAFELKGNTTVETAVTWNADATEATLTAPSVLLEGVYTVTASGDNFAEGKNVATVNVAKNGIATIEILGDNLVKIDNSNATVGYRLLDNYGVDITKNIVSESDLDIASSKILGADKFDFVPDKGIMTVKYAANELKDVTTAALTIISTKSGAAISKTLTVADPAQVDQATLNGISFAKQDTTKILTGEANAAYIDLSAVDQYGTDVTSATKLATDGSGDVLYVVSDSNVALTAEEYTNDNNETKARLIVDTTGLTIAKTVTVTAVSKLSGKSTSITLDVKEPAKPDKVSAGVQEALVAANDPANTFVLPLVVLDQDGVQLTNDEIASKAADFTISATGALSGKLAIATSGEYKGKVVNNAQLGNTAGTAVVTVSTSTDVATYTVDVNEAAYEKTIKVDANPAQNLLMGAVTKMNYKFIDQYGREMDSPAAGTKVTVEVSNNAILKATSASNNTAALNPYNSNAQELNAKDALAITTVTDEGTAKVTAKLYDQTGTTVISKVDTSVSVTKGVPGTLTFSIEDIPTLPALVAAGAVDGSDAYARPVKLVATDNTGKTYAIPTNRILSVTTTDTNVINLSNAIVTGAAIDAQNGYYVVAAQDEATVNFATDATTKTATIKFAISTDNGVKEVTKQVTVAKADPAVQSIVFADKPLNANDPYELDTNAKLISDINGTTADVTAQKLYVFEVDQYGVYTQVAAPTFTVVNMDRFTGSLGYASNQLVFNSAQIANAKDVYVMYQAANGVYGTFVINVSDGVATLDTTAPTVTTAGIAGVGAIAQGGSINIVFSEAIDAASKTAVETAVTAAATLNGTAAIGYSWNAGNDTLTVSETDNQVGDSIDLVAAQANITDIAGNTTTNANIIQ